MLTILAALALAQPCQPPEPLAVWVTRCGVSMRGAEMYQYEHLLPGQYVWSGFVPTPCQQWSASGLSCLQSITHVPLPWPADGSHLFWIAVDGEPCPDRLNPVHREFFTAEDWWWHRGDVDWSGVVDTDDVFTVQAWVGFNDPRGDWNADGLTTTADLTEYLDCVWYGTRASCGCP